MAWGIIYTIEDEKGKKSTLQVNIPGAETLNSVITAASGFATFINNVIRGVIRNVSVSQSIDLPTGLRTTPLSGADVEEGARFQFITTGGHYTGFRIPTFDEAYIEPDGSVDLTDGGVNAIVQAVTGNLDLNPNAGETYTIDFTDARDEQIDVLTFAREQFISSRGSGA